MKLVSFLVPWLIACGGAQSGSGTNPVPDDHPLHGAWATSTAPDGDPLPCPLVMELFDDGTVEVNYLNDDSPGKMCQFVRIPWEHDTSVSPHRIQMAGQLSSCIYRREGPALRLACEDHGRAPSSFDVSMLLQRIPVSEGSGLADIAGEWTAFSFWGGGAARMNVAANGDYTLGDNSGRIEIVNDHQLNMSLGEHAQACLYRVTEHRLTLRCQEASLGYPSGFLGSGVPADVMANLVLSRGVVDVPAGSAGSEPRHARAGADTDGDGLRDDDDQCPRDLEDYDGFEDEDGCPDADNDNDAVPDVNDQCPNTPENRNGIADEDGCPE